VYLDEFLYGGDDIEDDLEYILFNAVASTIPKYQTFKLLRWVQLFNPFCGFGWNFVCRWWHWILFTVSWCRESVHISSSQHFCYLHSGVILLYLHFNESVGILFNPLRPSGNYMNHPLWQSVMLNFVFIGFVWFSLQTAIISLNSVNQLIFVMVKYGVLFEVRTEFLNNI
jgi:hypothetical protein